MQRFSDNLPRIIHAAQLGRASLVFRTHPGPSLLWGGAEMLPTNIVRASEGESVFQRASASANFAAISLPVEDMCSLGEEMAGLDLTPPRDSMLISPAPAAMAKLQRLHAAAGDLAENAPEILANPDSARGLEQALTDALVNCLAHFPVPRDRAAQGQHAIIMRRFRRVVEENPELPLYIPEICKAIRVPSRTLRMVCQEHLGIGQSATCCCAACTWRGGHCGKHSLVQRRLPRSQLGLASGSSGAFPLSTRRCLGSLRRLRFAANPASATHRFAKIAYLAERSDDYG